MRYIQGVDGNQSLMFPELVDDYIKDDNPVRFIDAYIDSLDLAKLGFTHATTKDTGREPYNPSDLLKLYIYGYLNKTRSGRQLEPATHRNIELFWLLRKLHPDFKTKIHGLSAEQLQGENCQPQNPSRGSRKNPSVIGSVWSIPNHLDRSG